MACLASDPWPALHQTGALSLSVHLLRAGAQGCCSAQAWSLFASSKFIIQEDLSTMQCSAQARTSLLTRGPRALETLSERKPRWRWGWHTTPTSSEWLQSLTPQPLDLHWSRVLSVPRQRTLSSQMGPMEEGMGDAQEWTQQGRPQLCS